MEQNEKNIAAETAETQKPKRRPRPKGQPRQRKAKPATDAATTINAPAAETKEAAE